MSRVGGRNSVVAWIIGVLCVGAVAALVVLALPLLPWTSQLFGQDDSATEEPDAGSGPTVGACHAMYVEPLWASLEWTPGSDLDVTTDPPASSAPDVVSALSPTVDVTCNWSSDRGTITTTRGEVASDAGEILTSGLSELGFNCSKITDGADRVRCILTVKNDDDETVRIETIEAGDGIWLSTVQEGWWPEQYASRISDTVWNG